MYFMYKLRSTKDVWPSAKQRSSKPVYPPLGFFKARLSPSSPPYVPRDIAHAAELWPKTHALIEGTRQADKNLARTETNGEAIPIESE